MTHVRLWITEASPVVGNQAWAVYGEYGEDPPRLPSGSLLELGQYPDYYHAKKHALVLMVALEAGGTKVTVEDGENQ